jgi:sulfate transport system permease protein
VRKGNPKGIRDWDDVVRPGVSVIVANPKTSGGARWAYLAAWGYAERKYGSKDKAREFITALYKNVPVLDSGARGSTITFATKEIGDVLLAWENEAFLAQKEFGPASSRLWCPRASVLAEPPVAVVDKVAARKGTADVARAYLEYLYSDEGQDIAGRNFYRPRKPAIAAKYASCSPSWSSSPSTRCSAAGPRPRRPTSPTAASSTRSMLSDAATVASTRTHSARSILPGFGLSLGFTLAYLGLIVLVPLSAAFLKTAGMSWHDFTAAVASPRVIAAYRLSFGASLAAGFVNMVFGLVVAWVLVRYSFPGKRIVDALVDLPFALPTAVAGIALTSLYASNGWVGRWLAPLGFRVAFTWTGVFVALTFIGLPFVVRTVQPVLQELEPEIEEAASTLGANRRQTVIRILLPELMPSLLTGFALAFARALGEYGSVVFISGNMPMKTEIVPLLIITKLEQYDYRGATAIAVVMLVSSFVLLLLINLLQKWSRRFHAI